VAGPDAAFARAVDQLAALFGSTVRRHLRPLIASDWAGSATIGGAYSHALPGQTDARLTLARPFEDRVFFAGEAAHATDFSTAHGAYESGVRAAEEAIAALAPSLALPEGYGRHREVYALIERFLCEGAGATCLTGLASQRLLRFAGGGTTSAP